MLSFSLRFPIPAQGLSADPIFLVDDIAEIAPNKQTEAKKLITKNLEKKHVVDKVWSAQNETEALNLLRWDIELFPIFLS